ncbi:hypothetical protein AY601_1244 [Pedobacter cryoconitis]|uniref:Peptidase C39-like domain-containing protein n=1 Tax=Pedobacter cryoconitis TaxID=188932 RepID=A0A127VAD0_9SPHI|nr:hypothetical protein [Pedobacter cryoconitis]AMP98167.1 hypothetical protein AY601_1244 [Pedobacter cryoconitis]
MRKQFLLKHLFLVVPIMLFLHSCKKDNVPEVAKDQPSMQSLVEIAKSSLEKQSVAGSPLLSSLRSIGMAPDWSNIKTSINSENKTVLAIPLEQTTNSFSELNVIITNGLPHEVIKKYTVSNDNSILLEFYALNGTLLKAGQYDATSGKFQLAKSITNRVILYEQKNKLGSNGNLFLLLGNNKTKISTGVKTVAVNGIHDLEEVEIEGQGPSTPQIGDPQGPSTDNGYGPVDYYPVESVPPSGGSVGGSGSEGDPSKADHQLASANLPPNNTDDKQVANTCVFKTMEWINKYFGGSKDLTAIINKYAQSTGPAESGPTRAYYLVLNGVTQSEMPNLIALFFNTKATESIKSSIDVGFPLMGTISTGKLTNGGDIVGHEVMITGYNLNGSIQYFDPETGVYAIKASPAEFTNLITVTSNKN